LYENKRRNREDCERANSERTRGYKHVLGSTYPLKGEIRRLEFEDSEILEANNKQ
jgi:hypothetical protein